MDACNLEDRYYENLFRSTFTCQKRELNFQKLGMLPATAHWFGFAELTIVGLL